MDLADHLRVIAANWWRILLVTIIVGAGVFTYTNTLDPTYQGQILMNVSVRDVFENLQVNEQQLIFRAGLYARTVNDESMANAALDFELDASNFGDPIRTDSYTVRDKYGLDAKAALAAISTTTTDQNGLLLIKGTGGSRAEAKDITEAFTFALIENNRDQQAAIRDQDLLVINTRIEELQAAIDAELDKPVAEQDQGLIDVLNREISDKRADRVVIGGRTIIDIAPVGFAAAVGDEPIAPRPLFYSIFAALFAMFITAELFVLRRALSDRFGRTHDIESITAFTGLPVLAQIPRGRGPEIVEAFRTLRTNLMFLGGSGRPRTIALVSPNPGAGKSFAAIHLAESAVAVDAAVVLVDADLRRPVLHQRLRVPREPGLSDALRGTPLTDVVHRVEGTPNLLVMPSGSPVSDTVGVLGGKAFRQILDALDSAELVVVDTPPGAVYSDALAVSAQCDAALLVLDAKSTRRRAAKQLIEGLERTGATLIGVVVNGAQLSRRDTYERA